jgi:hypothetical protein
LAEFVELCRLNAKCEVLGDYFVIFAMTFGIVGCQVLKFPKPKIEEVGNPLRKKFRLQPSFWTPVKPIQHSGEKFFATLEFLRIKRLNVLRFKHPSTSTK